MRPGRAPFPSSHCSTHAPLSPHSYLTMGPCLLDRQEQGEMLPSRLPADRWGSRAGYLSRPHPPQALTPQLAPGHWASCDNGEVASPHLPLPEHHAARRRKRAVREGTKDSSA